MGRGGGGKENNKKESKNGWIHPSHSYKAESENKWEASLLARSLPAPMADMVDTAILQTKAEKQVS